MEKNQSSIEQKKTIEEVTDDQEEVSETDQHILEEREQIHLPLAGHHIQKENDSLTPKKNSERRKIFERKNHTDQKENFDLRKNLEIKRVSEIKKIIHQEKVLKNKHAKKLETLQTPQDFLIE